MNMEWQVISAAIFQGIAEFLPVSSSGHLEVLSTFFGIAEDERFTLSVVLHAGTLLSMLVFYAKEIFGILFEKKFRVIAAVIIGSIPAGIGGVFIKLTGMDSYFHNMTLVGVCFLFTGVLLLMLHKCQKKEIEYVPLEKMPYESALAIGFMQLVAVLPGISRSGSTIFAGAKCKLSPQDNAQFSFLLAIVAIGGASFLELLSVLNSREGIVRELSVENYITGFAVSALSGYLALTLLLKLLKSKKLGYFGIYMFLAGTFTLIYNIVS